MAWKKPTTITSWSYSRLSTYEQCPQLAKYKYIDKLPEPGSPAMERGSAIHKAAEDFLNGTIPRLPASLQFYGDEAKRVRKMRKADPESVTVETTWAFRADWTETKWNDWAGCRLRVKLDVAQLEDDTLTITDWKTGKYSPQWNLQGYVDQVELYATAALTLYGGDLPAVRVVPRLVFLDAGVVYPHLEETKVFTVADAPRLRKTWEKRAKPMLADKKFAPRPSSKCRWCHFRKENGGPCKF